jgi:hypothetical protein
MVVERRAADRRLEIAQPTAELASDLWKPLRTEDQQRDNEHKQQMRWLKNVADHTEEVSQLEVWRRLSFGGRVGAGIRRRRVMHGGPGRDAQISTLRAAYWAGAVVQ